MKYIDADLLIEKILQLHKEYALTEVKEDNKAMRAVLGGQCFTLMEVVKIIDSLQQEQQEVDLEKEIEEYWIAAGWSKVMTLGKFKVIARYFYGLGQLNSK